MRLVSVNGAPVHEKAVGEELLDRAATSSLPSALLAFVKAPPRRLTWLTPEPSSSGNGTTTSSRRSRSRSRSRSRGRDGSFYSDEGRMSPRRHAILDGGAELSPPRSGGGAVGSVGAMSALSASGAGAALAMVEAGMLHCAALPLRCTLHTTLEAFRYTHDRLPSNDRGGCRSGGVLRLRAVRCYDLYPLDELAKRRKAQQALHFKARALDLYQAPPTTSVRTQHTCTHTVLLHDVDCTSFVP